LVTIAPDRWTARPSGSNLTFRFFCGFPCGLDRASLGNARKNPDQTERCRASRVGSGYIQPKQSAEACLAGKDRPVDSGRPRHRRNHAANRKGQNRDLALARAVWRRGHCRAVARQDAALANPAVDTRGCRARGNPDLGWTAAGRNPLDRRGHPGAVGVSVSSVQRIWRAHGLQPHRVRQFKLSNDPQFIAKLRDIVGLYVNPPDHAIVLSIDEKSQIQALDRTQPMLPMKKRRAGTMTHDYKRHGITTLFAALDVLEGKVIGQCMKRQSATKTERPRHPRQLRRTQASQSSGMARSPSALCLPLHSDLGILAQCNRRAIRSPIQAAPQARRLSFAPGNSRMRSTAFSTTNANPKPFIWTKDPRQDHRCRKRGHQVLDSIH
jgi:hypothetical protein